MYRFDPIAELHNEHNMLTSNFALHQAALVEHAWSRAAQLFDQYKRRLERHMELEDLYLIPYYDAVKANHQWPVRVYVAEHQRIRSLIDALQLNFSGMSRRIMESSNLIAILDAEKTLKNVLDHHHRREEQAMFEGLRHAMPDSAHVDLVEAMLRPENEACRLDS